MSKKENLSSENIERKGKVIEQISRKVWLQYYGWNVNYMILKLLLAGQNPTRVKILRNSTL